MNKKPMRVLIYKRTHIGDPDESGVFGIYECMGQVRAREFDEVIGVGGIGPEAVRFGIDRKVNWIGIGRWEQHVRHPHFHQVERPSPSSVGVLWQPGLSHCHRKQPPPFLGSQRCPFAADYEDLFS